MFGIGLPSLNRWMSQLEGDLEVAFQPNLCKWGK